MKKKHLTIKNIQMRFSFSENEKEAELDDYKLESEGQYLFEAEDKKQLKKEIKKWMKEVISSGEYKRLKQEGFAIEIVCKDILKNSKKGEVAYHITNINNKESILKNGIIPNGEKDFTVYESNKIVDTCKTKKIEPNFKKSESVYLHTEISNDILFEKEYYENSSLFAVSLEGLEGYVGSMFVSGMVLFMDLEEEGSLEYNKKMTNSIKKEYGKLYWKNTMKLSDYVSDKKRRKKIDKEYGLDEILINSEIENEKFVHIGDWDENREFHPSENFILFMKEKITKEEKKEHFNFIKSKYA